MRNRLMVLLMALAFVLMMAGTALAHAVDGPVCDDGMPGHSEYAQNHIAHAAREGIIGQGHKPGAHNGWAGFCGVKSG